MAWRVLVRAKRFWLFPLIWLATSALAIWFALAKDLPLDAVLFGVGFAFVVGATVWIHAAYSTYHKYPMLFDRGARELPAKDREEIRSQTIFSIVTTSPLAAAGLTSVWLVTEQRFHDAVVTLAAGILAWQLLRLGLRRWLRR